MFKRVENGAHFVVGDHERGCNGKAVGELVALLEQFEFLSRPQDLDAEHLQQRPAQPDHVGVQ